VPAPRLVVLDFDGVIADSAPEAFAVALRTWLALRPESPLRARGELPDGPAAPPPARVLAHPLYAAFLELMPLGNRAEDYAIALHAIEAGASVPDQAAYDAVKAGLDRDWLRAFHRAFYRERTALSEADPEGWYRLTGPYPGIPGLLRRRGRAAGLAIATAKDRRSVARLLEAYAIADLFGADRILDKEAGITKRAHLERLRAATGLAFGDMRFVDDKVNHLDDVAGLGVRCALAGWGYNGPREASEATARGYPVLSLAEAEEGLFGG
jgi:phosphoglycolate phosphatase-like HAD superfamily hydrolase